MGKLFYLVKLCKRGWVTAIAIITALTVGCTPGDATTPTAPEVAVVRRLATVVIPPTPDRAQREATRRAQPVTLSPPTITPTVTETPYIGVFLGTPGDEDSSSGVSLVIEQGFPTAQPTFDDCAVALDPAFGSGWRTNPSVARRVGCALQQRFGFAGNVQVFERGVMYHRIDTNEIWAVQPGSLGAGKYWYANQPPPLTTEGLIPPPGLRAPGNAFGALWLTNGEVSTGLGYATTPEQSADLNLQRFSGGAFLLDVTVGQVFLFFDDGDAYGPY